MKKLVINLLKALFGVDFLHALHRIYRYAKPVKIPTNELLFLQQVAKYIPAGAVALDIGANVGKTGSVLAFEPLPEAFRFVQSKYGKLGNVQVFNLALSNESGRKKIMIDETFFAPPTAALTESAVHIKDASKLKEIEIVADRLDDVLNSKGITKVSFMKIDVEGHEEQVLAGARRTLEEHRPVIFMEILREKWKNSDPGEASALRLKELGYRMGQLATEDAVFAKERFDAKTENFIFLPANVQTPIYTESLTPPILLGT
jgi:FkbM family methyltransferase